MLSFRRAAPPSGQPVQNALPSVSPCGSPYLNRQFVCELVEVAEIVFSMLEALFDDTQTAALEDYLTAFIQFRYNDLQRGTLQEMRSLNG